MLLEDQAVISDHMACQNVVKMREVETNPKNNKMSAGGQHAC